MFYNIEVQIGRHGDIVAIAEFADKLR